MASMQRRTHKKSRAGCRECKQKHVKCDENRPACANCVAAKRICSYLFLSVSRPGRPPNSSSTSPIEDISSCSTELDATAERYTLAHIELVLHYEQEFIPAASMGSTFGRSFLGIALRYGIRAPYLMDQIVALSALHKSTTFPPESNQRSFYHAEAVKLQTRALAQYLNVQNQSEVSEVLSRFFFSSLLGQHLICNALRFHGDFMGTLDDLIQCFSLYRGTRAIAEHSWPTIQAQFEKEYGQPYPTPIPIDPDPTSAHTIYLTNLQRFIQESIPVNDIRDAYFEVIGTLGQKLDKQHPRTSDAFLRAEAVHEWVIQVHPIFVELLRQRRPEALVILAGFGVLLHNAKDCWAFEGAGSRLIRGVEVHLGTYWAKWLEWPKELVSQ